MVNINWADMDKDNGGGRMMPPGIYLCEVIEAREGVSKKTGDPYFRLDLAAVDFGRKKICDDILMLGGKGAGIGLRKLMALGIEKGSTLDSAHELLGKRVYARVDVEEWEKSDGTSGKQLKVNIKAPSSDMGYWPLSNVPDGVTVPGEDDTPF